MMSRGSPAMAWAMPSRWRMPPEYPFTFRLAAKDRFTRSRSSATSFFVPPGAETPFMVRR